MLEEYNVKWVSFNQKYEEKIMAETAKDAFIQVFLLEHNKDTKNDIKAVSIQRSKVHWDI